MKTVYSLTIFFAIVAMLLIFSMGYDYQTGHPGLHPMLAALICISLIWPLGFAATRLCEILERERFNKRHGFTN